MKIKKNFRSISEALAWVVYSQVKHSVNEATATRTTIHTLEKIEEWIDKNIDFDFTFQAYEDHERKSIEIKGDRLVKITGECGAVGIYMHPIQHIFWAKDGYVSQYEDEYIFRHDKGNDDNQTI